MRNGNTGRALVTLIELLDPTMPEDYILLHFGVKYAHQKIPSLCTSCFLKLRASGILSLVTGESLYKNQHPGSFYRVPGTVQSIVSIYIICFNLLFKDLA